MLGILAFVWLIMGAAMAQGGLTDQGRLDLRTCESTDTYDIDTGNSFYGAYQFTISTWNWTLDQMADNGYIGRDDWRGWKSYLNPEPEWARTPDTAPPWVQDAAATFLWDTDGPQHWPVCQHRVHNVGLSTLTSNSQEPAPFQLLAPTPVFTG